MFYLQVCLGITFMPGALRVQKRASDPQELELEKVMNLYVDAGNRTQGFERKSIQGLCLRIEYLSGLHTFIFILREF